MFTLELYDPTSGASRGYLRISPTGTFAREVDYCEKATHYISAPSAAIARYRFGAGFRDRTRVVECTCPGRDAWDDRIRDA